MNGGEHVDREKALLWLEGDARMLERIRVIFLNNIPGQVKNLGEALAAGDAESAERMAHTIRGSAAMMGATIMSDEAGRIERCAIERDLDGARIRFSSLALEQERVIETLLARGETA